MRFLIPALLLVVLPTTGALAQSSTKDAQTDLNLSSLFKQLDANNDGLLSQSEASAVPTIGKAYESFDTSATIQKPNANAHASGITVEQFKAGMQAVKNSGAFGPAVSGGEKYLVYPDGSRVDVSSTTGDANEQQPSQ